jgi:hypothetical protein
MLHCVKTENPGSKQKAFNAEVPLKNTAQHVCQFIPHSKHTPFPRKYRSVNVDKYTAEAKCGISNYHTTWYLKTVTTLNYLKLLFAVRFKKKNGWTLYVKLNEFEFGSDLGLF